MKEIICRIKKTRFYIKMLIIYKHIKYRNIFRQLKEVNILNDFDSINEIIKSKKSVARFGDGELNFIISEGSCIGFQNSSKELEKRLTEIFNEKQDKVLIGLPLKFINLSNDKLDSRKFWTNYIVKNGKELLEIINKDNMYINTNFTRFYMDYINKKNVPQKIELIRKIWNDRNLVIIEGNKTKMGVGNDFFDNAKSIKRIICPAKDAFSSYNTILNTIKKVVSPNDLIIIALGPTATVLAYDLGMLGYQALDMGHVDIEYEWYIKGVNEKIAIDGKYVNEKRDTKIENTNIDDEDYISSIVANIK